MLGLSRRARHLRGNMMISLRDTGRMTVEELAQKHLGTDLTQPDFWQNVMNLVIADIEQFLEMTETTK